VVIKRWETNLVDIIEARLYVTTLKRKETVCVWSL